jgi:hypothetical protein
MNVIQRVVRDLRFRSRFSNESFFVASNAVKYAELEKRSADCNEFAALVLHLQGKRESLTGECGVRREPE